MANENSKKEQFLQIPIGSVLLSGDLTIIEESPGVVLFAHGSGSSRHSHRNRYVAKVLQDAGLNTLLFDLLTEQEEIIDEQTSHLRFDIGLLTNRLVAVTDWLVQNNTAVGNNVRVAYFGASTGAAAALAAAAKRVDIIKAVVSRGGRPDLAEPYLGQVKAPTLLLVGGHDTPVIKMNQEAFDKLQQLSAEKGEKKIVVIPGATHLFEELGKLELVAQFASEWFTRFILQS
ncbi:MAG: dienelactone hydrolase family protein [Thermoproteota archaeon]|nr:dienelactone hydrolase family protein [Thermoproteota archaeon]